MTTTSTYCVYAIDAFVVDTPKDTVVSKYCSARVLALLTLMMENSLAYCSLSMKGDIMKQSNTFNVLFPESSVNFSNHMSCYVVKHRSPWTVFSPYSRIMNKAAVMRRNKAPLEGKLPSVRIYHDLRLG